MLEPKRRAHIKVMKSRNKGLASSNNELAFGDFGIKSTQGGWVHAKEIEAARMLKKLQPEDLLKFGLIPEFIGRIPIYAVLDPLDESTLKMILTEPKNAVLKQYKCLLKMDGVDLEFEPDAIELIAKEAIKRKTGARALRSIVEELMLDIMYDIPSNSDIDKFVITKEMVEAKNKKNEQAELIPLHKKDKPNEEKEIDTAEIA